MRLLLCVRDVTEMRKLALAASAQRRELAIIGEILALEPAKFERFIDGSQRHLAENLQAVRSTEGVDAGAQAAAVDLLFRNMHTIKGNARTYGLQQLTDVVHRVEQDYDALRCGAKAWDTEALLDDLHTVRRALEEYAAIHTHKLGRAASAPRRPATQALGDMLEDVLQALPALAVELEKEEPRIAIEDGGLRLSSHAAGVLQDTFMHLLRNAMDHGLETPLARIAKGKPAAGQIRIGVAQTAGGWTITTADDGRGLDLDAIRRKAVERQLVAADAEVSQADIARYIFLPGFSTAQQVTDISGRGVGMDAVRSLVQSLGGRIDIELLGREGEWVRGFQTVLTLPAGLAWANEEEMVVAA